MAEHEWILRVCRVCPRCGEIHLYCSQSPEPDEWAEIVESPSTCEEGSDEQD